MHTHPGLAEPTFRAPRERDANLMMHFHSGLAKARFCTPRTQGEPYGAHPLLVGRTAGCIPRTRCEPHGTHSIWIGEPRFPEPDANHMVQTHSGLAKPRFSNFKTRREPYGTHSVWVGESPALHSQNEMRTLWRTLILGCRTLGFAFSERDANPMVHIHFGKAKPRLCIPRTRYEPRGAH